MSLKSDISKSEFVIYLIVWCSAVLHSIYCFAVSSNKGFQHYDETELYFDEGWSLLQRKKDNADFEWRMMKSLINSLALWVISSTLISEILRYFRFILVLQLWQILVAVAFVMRELGVYASFIILLQPLIFSLVVTTRKKSLVWCTSLLAFLLISLYKIFTTSEEFLNVLQLDEESSYLVMIAICWMNLRCVSFCMDLIDTKENPPRMKILAYCLYLPSLICGPIILYTDFQGCYQFRGNTGSRIFALLRDVARFVFWLLFVEFFLHFIYVNAINFHPELVGSLDSWSLYGYGYTMGQFFHMKYLVTYGLAVAFAKFENIQVPTLPVCIGRIHLYSDMWKYFDAGLYKFLIRYIYVPLMKSQLIKVRLLASLICFIFIYVWHGIEYYVFMWASLNYIGIVSEFFGKWVYESFLQNMNIENKLGPRWFRRITCMAQSPLLALSALSNFYFFAGDTIASIFVSRVLSASWSTVMLLAILYTVCQVATEIKLILNTTKKQKSF